MCFYIFSFNESEIVLSITWGSIYCSSRWYSVVISLDIMVPKCHVISKGSCQHCEAWVYFRCSKLVFHIQANPEAGGLAAHRKFSLRNPRSAQESGISRASPTSRPCFSQGLREEISPAVCTAPTPLLSQNPNYGNNSVAEMSLSSQGWSSCAGLPGDTTGDITGTLHTYKGSLCRAAHLRENWYPCVYWLL